MNDPPTHEDIVARGFNTRPPSMIERRLASPTASFGTQYGAPGPQTYDNYAPGQQPATPDSYAQYSSFRPGQDMNNSPPYSATPMYQSASYVQSPFSPIASPVPTSGSQEQEYNASALSRQPSTGTQLTRRASDGHSYQSYNTASGPTRHQGNYSFALSHETGGTFPSSEYVDLRRAASVTPLQAAQYAEISKRLNAELPNGITSAEYAQRQEGYSLPPPVPPKDERSPFDDPIPSSFKPAKAVRDSTGVPTDGRPFSVESHWTVSVAHEFDFPEPPSPALTVASRFRVDSNPPKLPEINLDSRASVHSSLGSELSGGLLSTKAAGARSPLAPSPLATSIAAPSPSAENIPLPATPTVATSAGERSSLPHSPLASSFAVPSPSVENIPLPATPIVATSASARSSLAHSTPAASFAALSPSAENIPLPATPTVATSADATEGAVTTEEPRRRETIYDPEDAYGGI